MRPLPRLLLGVLLLAVFALPWAWPASAQVRRCVQADGTEVYTDRACEAIGARERLPPSPPRTGDSASAVRPTCARSVEDLAYAVQEALQAGDANRLAAWYDWSGMRTADGYRLMERLQAIAARPLVDVQPAYAAPPADAPPLPPLAAEPGAPAPAAPPPAPRLRGLQVEQTLSDGHTPSRVLFGLSRRYGCWWLRL